MNYVYGIAFEGDEFVMVFNPRRGGWEMPGGKLEEGETSLEAMLREFREEVGREFLPKASSNIGGVSVYAGGLGGRPSKAEMEWRIFRELPRPLSFPLVEYISIIDWAREATGRARPSG